VRGPASARGRAAWGVASEGWIVTRGPRFLLSRWMGRLLFGEVGEPPRPARMR
jgi:hypothetical protein